VEFVLAEGRNRPIRRMGAAAGHEVKRLVRVAIGGLELGEVPAGAFQLQNANDQRRLQGQ
jgi:23S rRNA pseudouridine2605 synthase